MGDGSSKENTRRSTFMPALTPYHLFSTVVKTPSQVKDRIGSSAQSHFRQDFCFTSIVRYSDHWGFSGKDSSKTICEGTLTVVMMPGTKVSTPVEGGLVGSAKRALRGGLFVKSNSPQP